MKQNLNILMLEDSKEDFELVNRVLRKEGLLFTSRCVDSKEEFRKQLHDFNPDVVLSDHALPLFNSLEALTLCRNEGFQHLPFILVTGAVSEEFAVRCLKQGADDYILKSQLTRLPSAIVNAIRQRDSEQRKIKAERRLKKQHKQLVKINKDLDVLVFSVSHNLRAPLKSLLGLVNLFQFESEKQKQKISKGLTKYFAMIRKGIFKLDDSLKEILDYSKNARTNLSLSEVDLHALICEEFEKVKYLPGYDRIKINISVASHAPLYSDSYRLGIILNNLISNAIKYADGKKEESYINLKAEISEHQVSIFFEDNGIGIFPEHRDKIFGMFYRATDASEGAGLGLYIVKEALEKLRGSILVETEPGIGTTFKMVIPNNKTQHLKKVGANKSPDHAVF